MVNEIQLKYGLNPYQGKSKISVTNKELPFELVNGFPSYTNILDALNSWALVKELNQILKLPVAASFKHVSPAGVGVGDTLADDLRKAYFVEEQELSPTAIAYIKARGGDPAASYGDWIAISDIVDVQTANFIKNCVSDGIIAPGYEAGALAILKQKKNNKYVILKIDKNYIPDTIEKRQVYGITLEQERNDFNIDGSFFDNIVTANRDISGSIKKDLIIATITAKYTQSNSVALAYQGQAVGIGAGQQSRIHCVRLACTKAEKWFLRQHPKLLNLQFNQSIKLYEKVNCIDILLEEESTDFEKSVLEKVYNIEPALLAREEKIDWLNTMDHVSLSSDGFIPFSDTIERAKISGVKYIIQPGGSIRDQAVIQTANHYNMAMIFSKVRLFHH